MKNSLFLFFCWSVTFVGFAKADLTRIEPRDLLNHYHVPQEAFLDPEGEPVQTFKLQLEALSHDERPESQVLSGSLEAYAVKDLLAGEEESKDLVIVSSEAVYFKRPLEKLLRVLTNYTQKPFFNPIVDLVVHGRQEISPGELSVSHLTTVTEKKKFIAKLRLVCPTEVYHRALSGGSVQLQTQVVDCKREGSNDVWVVQGVRTVNFTPISETETLVVVNNLARNRIHGLTIFQIKPSNRDLLGAVREVSEDFVQELLQRTSDESGE